MAIGRGHNKGGRPSKKGRSLTLPGNPELPSKASMERIDRLWLKNYPEIVEAIQQTILTNGYKTAPEAVRHLLFVGISATPTDGEFRAAMTSVRSQMTQYLTTRFWAMLAELFASFEKDWREMHGSAFVDREIARLRGEAPKRCTTCGHEGAQP